MSVKELFTEKSSARRVILASSSPYRRQLLARLGLPVDSVAPSLDESRRAGEPAREYAQRLAIEKAQAVAPAYPEALIIAADQVALCQEQVLGKPGTRENAVRQLTMLSGSRADFLTALCVLHSATGRELHGVETYSVYFKTLSRSMVENYLDREPAFDCAGAFKSEGFGIVLVDKFEGEDPTTLIGLPLIRLIDFLNQFGCKLI